ncbi:transglycosylase domain-containing protein [Patescibacteria group bacterium]
MAYKTRVKYKRKRAYKSRFSKRLKKLKSKRGKKSWSRSALGKDSLKGKMKKILGVTAGVVFILIFIGTVFSLSIVAKYSSELPNPDEPFERGQDLTSFVYDRNGKELYKIHGDENRDIVQIDEVPLEAQWAFIAAEDLDFYTHKGVDLGGVVKAGLYEVFKIGSPRGGSTITQQMIKNTVLTTERSYERKIKEIILSLRIEQKYDKQEVLQLYVNEIGFGGNTYGVKTAARIYFGKEVSDLSLGEAALLAGLPQAPGIYSPLFASDVTKARELAIVRQNYVLDQMLANKDTINSYARKHNDLGADEELITEEKIQAAREHEIIYKTSDVHIEAPHFVFYVEDELQKGNYNDGKPFTLSEIERGGLKITTSLDLDMQQIAEETVTDHRFGMKPIYSMDYYGANNASLVTIDPKTGQILAMVGSASYFEGVSPEGCTLGLDCKFEPKVNVSVSLRQPGSSLKPMVYYTGFESGQLYPAYPFLDIDVPFTGGYKPKK